MTSFIQKLRFSLVLFAGATALSTTARAATDAAPVPTAGLAYRAADSVSLGYTLHRFQDDFGMSASLASPTFVHDRLRVTLGGGFAWYPYATSNGKQTWADYGHVRLVMEGGLRAPRSPIRIYGFGGPILELVPDRLSKNSVALGGVGGFGFEYYFMSEDRDGPVSYMMELGGIGTSAKADKLAGQPMFGTGFLITVGLRWYL